MKQPKHPILLLVLACFAIFFVNLDVWHVNIMEARNFISAREMLTDNNWLLPTLNGQARYQKPPLPTWLTAISGAIFGIKNLTSLRLPAAIMAVILVLTSYRFVITLVKNKAHAVAAALIVATSFLIVFAGRNGQWDIFTNSFMFLGIYWMHLFFSQNEKRIKHSLLAGLFIGLSGMSKGPVAMYSLLIPFLVSYGLVYKFKGLKSRWMGIFLIIIFGGILASSWYYYAYTNDTALFLEITQKETANWTRKNIRPFYYYWSFFLQSGIWAIAAFISLLYPYLRHKVVHKKAYLFTVLWTLVSLLLLSVIPEKKSRYLLPVLIPLALNTSFYLGHLFKSFNTVKDPKQSLPVYINFGLIAFIALAFPFAGYVFLNETLNGNWIWFILLSVSLFGIGIFILRKLLQKNIQAVFYGTVGIVCVVIVFGMPLSKSIFPNPEYKPLSKVTTWESENHMTVYEYAVISIEMVWDYGEKLPVIKRNNIITLPNEGAFGVLVSKEQHTAFLETFKNYTVEKITRYDMNTVAKGSKSHRTRLWRDLYLVKRSATE